MCRLFCLNRKEGFTMIVIYILAIVVALLLIYMFKEAHEHNIHQHEVQILGEHDVVKIIFISDVHNRKIHPKKLQTIGFVDAVIIGGDFCDRRTSEQKLVDNLSALSSLGPIYFIWGNNDREFGESRLRGILHQFKATIIENDAIQLPNRSNSTWISAIDDTSTKNYSFKQALQKCQDDDVIIFVSHNPQVFHLARQQKKVSLLMGGHLHGGQIRFGKFGLHPHGSFLIRQGVPTLISNGYGTTLVPLRLGAQPQMHVITLQIDKNRKDEVEG